jgi:SAM-dependent methyltransferase
MMLAKRASVSGAKVGRLRLLVRRALDLQWRFRRRYGGPYRSLLAAACRLIFARGQLDTSRIVYLREIGLAAPDRLEHSPSGWLFLRRALKGCVVTEADTFVDFGSGMGRAVYLAARHYPFGRVVGVELSPELNAVAIQNLDRMRPKLKCANVEFVTSEATAYRIPDDMTYAYLFNPFTGDLFRTVLDNIIASLDRSPRRLILCYANPVMDSAVLDSRRFVKVRDTTGLRRDIPIYRIAVYRSI